MLTRPRSPPSQSLKDINVLFRLCAVLRIRQGRSLRLFRVRPLRSRTAVRLLALYLCTVRLLAAL